MNIQHQYLVNFCFFFAIIFHSWSLHAKEYLILGSEQQGWKALIDSRNGTLQQYEQRINDVWEVIPFRKDTLAGPSWKGINLSPVATQPNTFAAEVDGIRYMLQYLPMTDHLVIECKLTNLREKNYEPEYSRLILGIDSEMRTFPEWDTKFFPTLLRCEKNFTWGYFMSPRQIILAIGVEEPVACYTINYVYEGLLKWKWGHQVKTASLDLLHCLPLPERHPQNMYSLKPGETKNWNLHLGGIEELSDVKKTLSQWIQTPMIECDKYTITEKEKCRLLIHSRYPLKNLIIKSPNDVLTELPVDTLSENLYTAYFVPLGQNGIFQISATALNGKTAETNIYVRNSWSWYMKNARDFVAKNPPLFSNSCETFYGYYTAFLGARHFPDAVKDQMLEARFCRTLPLLIDTLSGIPKIEGAPDRIQNFSSLIGMLVDLWETTENLSYLEKAAQLGDYLCSEKIQSHDGAYRSKGTHYTAVIYPAKSMLELVRAEKKFIGQPKWKERYDRHKKSAYKAIDDLLMRLDDIQTEGDMTFEDGMITCSALQLALRGLLEKNTHKRKQYTDAAIYLMNKHRCLEQLLIPDCRMRGATLRFWEALDIYFVPNQIMNSPHGWTAWKIYASYYLYLLTGKVYYLTDFMDTLGACAQIMDLNGSLRWGFVPDPYIKGQVCSERRDKQHDWYPVDSIVGEQYLDMISPWLRPDDEYSVCSFGKRGGSGDNTVQEIFKAMEECTLTSAYVAIDEKGNIQCWNCSAWKDQGVIHIVPDESMITGIHLNTSHKVKIETNLAGKHIRKNIFPGMHWLGNKPLLIE